MPPGADPSRQFRDLRAALAPLADAWPSAAALIERLDRDLLPRTAGSHEHLVVGIVGPNNAGKSALFDALAGGVTDRGAPVAPKISPSVSTGGATRRLVGAIHPNLRAILESEPTLARFPMRGVTPGPDGVTAATESADEGLEAELLLVEVPSLPESLLLVDTPDFDSVLRQNRQVTDALLQVADLAVVVVTRHTYQNHDVIEFLSHWLEHGRPWVLVYNESIDARTTRSHAQKIASDLGSEPEGVYHAPFDADVGERRAALVPCSLEDESQSVGSWLLDLGARRDLKARAMRASVRALRDGLTDLAAEARALEGRAADALGDLDSRATTLGRAVARDAMPMGPFLEAFREVLDERPTAVQREIRRGLKWTGERVTSGARWLSSKLRGGSTAPVDEVAANRTTLLDAERAELRKRWTGFFEPALVDLRNASRSYDSDDRLGAALEEIASAPPSPTDALARAEEALALDPALLSEYRVACREIIAEELDKSGNEWFLQIAIDVLHLAPLGVAGAVIAHTGGLGADLAVAGGGAVSAAMAERLSRTLGSGVAASARTRWTELRAGRIGAAATAGLLGEAEASLTGAREGAAGVVKLADDWLGDLDWRTIERGDTIE